MMSKTNILKHEEMVKIIDSLSAASDDLIVNAEKAALYLGISPSNLSRYRNLGNGPEYIQYPSLNTSARNQKIQYKMKALRDWQSKHTFKSTLDAANKRCMTFSTVNDLIQTQPFWIKGNLILSLVSESNAEVFARNFIDMELTVGWLNWQKVFSKDYSLTNEMITHKDKYVRLLRKLLDKAN